MNALDHKQQYQHHMFDFITQAVTVRDMAQNVLYHACMSKARDEAGEVGCTCITDFVKRAGEVRLLPITTIVDYILFVFTPSEVELDKDGKPIVRQDKSALSYDTAKHAFGSASDLVADDNGKNRRKSRTFDAYQVKQRLNTWKWWDFNPAKPIAPYKGKFASALKSDLNALAEGKFAATHDEAKFLMQCQRMAEELGISLGK